MKALNELALISVGATLMLIIVSGVSGFFNWAALVALVLSFLLGRLTAA